MNTLTIFCPELLTPGLNEWQRMHFRTRARWNKKVTDYLVAYGNGLAKFTGKVKVIVKRCRRAGPRAMDDDNAAASAKSILDALKKLEVIEDDSPEHVELEVQQENVGRSGEWGTWIHVEKM